MKTNTPASQPSLGSKGGGPAPCCRRLLRLRLPLLLLALPLLLLLLLSCKEAALESQLLQ